MSDDSKKSLSDEATFAGAAKRRPAAEMSLGDERTRGDRLGDQDTVIDDIEVVDLEARYKVEGTLGQGGMGVVLLATDTRLGRKVAIKRILGEAAGNRMAVQRFLTEAEWEYVCRAGITSRYSFGDDGNVSEAYAWFGDESGHTHPVGCKQPNAWGLYEMHGNVSEWCSDWYGPYSQDEDVDPKGPGEGRLRVSRGGCWWIAV
ncbi:MAG: SUMF1/EgtB/PvdO family nonheme iron enzyme, partial [Planctomycetia bacterium]